jgi:hypothetical protein
MSEWPNFDHQLEGMASPVVSDIPVLRPSSLNPSILASGLARDLRYVFRRLHQELPTLINDLNTPVTLQQRYDALQGYVQLVEQGDSADPVIQRARLVTQLYFDLTYFRDQVLILVRRKLLEQGGLLESAPYLSEWLKIVGGSPFAEEIRALRNGFAHGKWAFLPGYLGIVCYPERTPPYSRYEFSEDRLALIHRLIYAFLIVFFKTASEEISQ